MVFDFGGLGFSFERFGFKALRVWGLGFRGSAV